MPTTKIATMLECRRVGKVLQRYLDGTVDDHTARRVAAHLDSCRRCGFEVSTYRELKRSLTRRDAPVDQLALTRLRAFAAELAAGDEPPGDHLGS